MAKTRLKAPSKLTPKDQDRWFWSIVEQSRVGWSVRRASGNQRRQAEALRQALEPLPPADLVRFNRILKGYMHRAYRWDLWGAAYVLAGGCSDDAFYDFRSWLISMGRRAYAAALRSPGEIWKIAESPGVECAFFLSFQNVASGLYRERQGRQIPISLALAIPLEPRGRRWASDDELRRRYRKLWSLYRG